MPTRRHVLELHSASHNSHLRPNPRHHVLHAESHVCGHGAPLNLGDLVIGTGTLSLNEQDSSTGLIARMKWCRDDKWASLSVPVVHNHSLPVCGWVDIIRAVSFHDVKWTELGSDVHLVWRSTPPPIRMIDTWSIKGQQHQEQRGAVLTQCGGTTQLPVRMIYSSSSSIPAASSQSRVVWVCWKAHSSSPHTYDHEAILTGISHTSQWDVQLHAPGRVPRTLQSLRWCQRLTNHLIGKNVLELHVQCQFTSADSVTANPSMQWQWETSPIRSWLHSNICWGEMKEWTKSSTTMLT